MKATTLRLSGEALGFGAAEIPDIDLTGYQPPEQGMFLDGFYRDIAPIPGEPDYLVRWQGGKIINVHTEADWRDLIEMGTNHFSGLAETGIEIVPPAQPYCQIPRRVCIQTNPKVRRSSPLKRRLGKMISDLLE